MLEPRKGSKDSMSRRSSSKLKAMSAPDRMMLQCPRLGLASEAQLNHLAQLMPEGGVKAIQALLNLMHSGVVDCLIWNRESWVGDSAGSVTGIERDKLDLMRPVAMPPTGGCNLMHSEGVLENMLSQLKESVSSYEQKFAKSEEPIEKLAQDLPRQVLLLVQRIRFTSEVNRCIRENRQLGTVQRAFLDIKKRIAEILMDKEIEEKSEKNGQPGYPANLKAIQKLLHEQFQVLKMLGEEKEEKLAAAWDEQVKFYYDDKELSIDMKMGSKVVGIGNEYSAPNMLITTEFTHTLRWAYIDKMVTSKDAAPAADGLRCLCLIGTHGCGKTGMLVDVGQVLGTLPTILRASESMPSDEVWWRRNLTAAFTTGGGPWAPVIISQAHRAPKESLETCMKVAEELNLSLCLTMIDGPKTQELASGVLAGHLTIKVPPSDLKVIAAGQMAAEGILQSDELSVPLGAILEGLEKELSKQPHYDFGPRTLMQICTQIGYDKKKNVAEKDTVGQVLERCLLPKMHRDDAPILEKLLNEHLGVKKKMVSAGKMEVSNMSGDGARWYSVAENIKSITKHEPDCMVLPVKPDDEEHFYDAFTKMLNRSGSAMVMLEERLSDVTGEELLGTMPRAGEAVKDGILVNLLRKAMEDHVDPNQLVWIAMKTGSKDGTKNISPEVWEALHELLDDSGCINLATGEQLRLHENLRFLFIMPGAGDTPQDTFSRSGVVYTDPPPA